MSGREVESNAMVRVAQKRSASGLRSQDAGSTFDSQLIFNAADAGNQADDRFREMNIEIVTDDVPARIGSGVAQQAAEKPREILFRPGIADHPLDLASGDIEGGDQGLSAVALVFEFSSFDLAWHLSQ
jgi:hypothetical protein